MTLSYTTTIRSNRMTQVLNAVGDAGFIKIYSGSVPANVAASLGAAVLLAQLTTATPFGTVTSGVLTLGTVTSDSSADNTGTASFYRQTDSGGTAQIQGSVGTSGADMNLNTTAIVAGATVSITSGTYTEGNA